MQSALHIQLSGSINKLGHALLNEVKITKLTNHYEDENACKNMNEEVIDILTKNLVPKDFEKNVYGEVFTPIHFVEKMLDALPASVWKKKCLKWFDPACGIGNFPIIVYYRLMKSLKSSIVSDKVRSKHIIEKMLFMNDLNHKNVVFCKKIFAMIDPEAEINISNKDFLELTGSYDIIVGNPPYNEARIKETSEQPLYSKFIVKAIEISNKLMFVVPSRWFSGGKGLDKFRKSMLSRKDIVSIHHISNSQTIWPEVDIKGGVNYFYLDKSYHGLTKFTSDLNKGQKIQLDRYDILVPDTKLYPLISKVVNYPCLSELYLSTGHFGITTNSEHFTNEPMVNSVKCYVSAKKGEQKFVNKKYIKNEYDFWKVFTPQGSGKGGDGFGNIIIGTPSEIASQTYFGFKVGSEKEAKSLKSYLETDFANYMLSLRKIDQHISKTTLKWLPLPPLDREWTDEKVSKYYGLNAKSYLGRIQKSNKKTMNLR
jgi:site-specific DNA-methyltransferase (adenine-specific)